MTVHSPTASRDDGRPLITSTTGPGSGVQLMLLRTVARVCDVLGSGPRWTRRGTAGISKVFPARNAARCTVFGNRVLQVSMTDRYWMPSVLTGIPYEPEMLQALRRLLHPDSIFIDCGANIGWWSIYATTVIGDPRRVLAIEPERRAFTVLDANRTLNEGRFDCLKVAVGDTNRDTVDLRTARNRPASSVLVEHEEAAGGFSMTQQVRSVRLDTIIDERFRADAASIVLKLDVEGAESSAFEGAGHYLNQVAAIIYEDHGRDLSCAPSRDLLERGFAIFAPQPNGALCRMRSVEQISDFKREPGVGYNFVAVRPGSEAHATLEKDSAT